MDHQMEKKMEVYMETGMWAYRGFIGGYIGIIYITRNRMSSHLPTCMLRRTQSTGKCVFTGLDSGGVNPLE